MKPKIYNCPNCGGEIEHTYNHKCKYCGGMLDFNEPQEKTIQVKPEDLVNITLREVTINHETNNLMLIFDGYKLEQPKVYECDGLNNYVSKVQNYINPPKCGFCLEIPILKLREYGIDYVLHRIYRCEIRPSELERVIYQVKEKIERWCL